MVNKSTKMNTTNNHLSPQIIEHIRVPQHITLEMQVSAWDRHTNVAGLNHLMRSQPYPSTQLDLHLQYRYMYKQTNSLSQKSPHTSTKKNDNINMDKTIAGSVNAHT
jgi:hypothetical protein